MIKKITFNDETIQINDNNGWLYDYREQFGEDFMVTVYPVLAGAIESIGELKDTGGVIDTDTAISLLASASAIKSTVISDVLWAMAKNADTSLPDPREWANQFDGFPVDEIGIPLLESIMTSFMSKKKVTKLMQTIQTKVQSISTFSPSQESTEG